MAHRIPLLVPLEETAMATPVYIPNLNIIAFEAPDGAFFPNQVSTTVGHVVEVQTTNVIKNAFKIATYNANLHVSRRISRRLTLDTNLAYWQQDTTGSTLANTVRDAFRVDVGFIWTFDPIPL